MKKLFILTLTLAIFVGGCQQKQETQAPQKPVVKIGATFPLSGDYAFMGEGAQHAVSMALDQLKEKDTAFQYEVIYEDDQGQAPKSVLAVNKLINVDKVDVLISSGACPVISPIAQKHKIIHFGLTPGGEMGGYTFLHWTQPDAYAKKMTREFQKRKIGKIAIVTVKHPGAFAIIDALKKSLEAENISVVDEEQFKFGTRDFKNTVVKIKEASPDIVMVLSFSPELEIFARQMKELDANIPLTAIESFGMTQNPELFEGCWYVDVAEGDLNFRTKFEARSGCVPTHGAANMYDMVNLTAYGFENTKYKDGEKPSNQEVLETLYKIKDYDSAVGKISIDANGIIHSQPNLKEIRNGKPVIIEKDL